VGSWAVPSGAVHRRPGVTYVTFDHRHKRRLEMALSKRDWYIAANVVCILLLLPPPVLFKWLAKKITTRYGDEDHKKESD
jgi:hypothetical protein